MTVTNEYRKQKVMRKIVDVNETTEQKISRWKRFFEIVSSAGEIAMSLATAQNPVGYLGAGMRAVNLGFRIREEIVKADVLPAESYFTNRGWRNVHFSSNALSRLIAEHATERRFVPGYSTVAGNGSNWRPVEARLAGVRVGWTTPSDDMTLAADDNRVSYCGESTVLEDIYGVIGERLWSKYGTGWLSFVSGKIVADTVPKQLEGNIVTEQFVALGERLLRFTERSGADGRGVLLNGPPGTGKSLGARWLASVLGDDVRVLSIDAAEWQAVPQSSDELSVAQAMAIFRPRVLILDDLDRGNGFNFSYFLKFLEIAREKGTVVVVTANCHPHELGPLLRPGRIDDVVHVDRLDDVVVRSILDRAVGGTIDGDVPAMVADLPAAYVVDFAERYAVLGRDAALAELPELRTRAKALARREGDDVEAPVPFRVVGGAG